jgi:radical SAM protein with 4Fe4S-binding SPASM domain
MDHKYDAFKFRYEPFGGIIQLERPSSLIFVDREYMRGLGYPESPLWDKTTDILSAPTEVHLALTRQCSVGCKCCYMDSKPQESGVREKELGREGIFAVLSKLAQIKVFHVALGGGESAELPYLFEVGHIARSLGMIPNLTTNGFHVSEETAGEYSIFGQVNISIDGVDELYGTHRGFNAFPKAVQALKLLREHGVRTGINCVVSRHNFDRIEDVFRLGKKAGIKQLELLRYKPAGRAASDDNDYKEHDLTDAQAWDFYPRIMALAKKYKTPLSIDCSLTPYLYCHNPDRKKLDFYGVTGCLGGNMLCGVGPDGTVSACSFSTGEGRRIENIQDWWGKEETFFSFRKWVEAAPQPCAACEYLSLCRGGCHVVSRHVTGDVFNPDPGCPIVRKFFS